MRSRYARLLVLALVIMVLTAGASQLFAGKPPSGGGCPTCKPGWFCPDYYCPVVCDNGCRYSNECFAACAGAKNCSTCSFPQVD